ncbi:MAG: 2-C-methyl-D-erythritol 4-phosphate cytidylyltransferase [Planctomycetes bacterium]|nr:2-C-methyl-D-erythritol 4-phosphate cytidylyltransferase [Planctomycetota bacterium]
MLTASAVLLAAGKGLRLGGGAPKAFRPLRGRPMVEWSLEALASLPEIREIVLVLPAGAGPGNDFRRFRVGGVVAGGTERFDSVLAGLRSLREATALLLVHDAARPLVRPETVRAVIAAADRAGGAIAAIPAADTLKRVGPDHRILETIPREAVWRAQTPQAFRREPFAAAMEAAAREGERPTDDAAVAERAGMTVVVVPGDETNLKVTTAGDLALAEQLLAAREASRS